MGNNLMKKVLIDVSSLSYTMLHGAVKSYEDMLVNPPYNKAKICEYDFSKDNEYVAIFNELFIGFLKDTSKTYEIGFSDFIYCVDCPRHDIWRAEHYDAYKANRNVKRENVPNFKTMFEYIEDRLIPKITTKTKSKVMKVPHAEADDVIYVIKEHIKNDCEKIYVVTGDSDLYQVLDDKTTIIRPRRDLDNVEYSKDIKHKINMKILTGDKSDNIPACFEKTVGDSVLSRGCGPKTAERLLEDIELLKSKFNEYPNAKEQYKLNSRLILLKNIPDCIKDAIIGAWDE